MDFSNPKAREVFFDVHSGLPREGPGDHDSTARALMLAKQVSPCTKVLDIACGPGQQTMHLAELLPKARITALDLHAPFLQELSRRAADNNVSDRVTTVRGDMRSLPFRAGSFDLIWCEGAAYTMGVAAALRTWQPLLKPDGTLALTEAVWLKPDPPEIVRRGWAEYPDMTDIDGCRRIIRDCGYTLLGDFVLPEQAWLTDYYEPMAKRIETLDAKYASDPVGTAVLQECRDEIQLYRDYAPYYGYAFLVMCLP